MVRVCPRLVTRIEQEGEGPFLNGVQAGVQRVAEAAVGQAVAGVLLVQLLIEEILLVGEVLHDFVGNVLEPAAYGASFLETVEVDDQCHAVRLGVEHLGRLEDGEQADLLALVDDLFRREAVGVLDDARADVEEHQVVRAALDRGLALARLRREERSGLARLALEVRIEEPAFRDARLDAVRDERRTPGGSGGGTAKEQLHDFGTASLLVSVTASTI